MVGTYIKSIEVNQLWQGGHHVRLDFKSGVNVLSGMNGVGKSTIISMIAKGLQRLNSGESLDEYGVNMVFEPEGTNHLRYNFIKSFDSPLMTVAQIEAINNPDIRTYLDWKLWKIQRAERLTENAQWPGFCDLVDDLFKDTGKLIDRESNVLRFFQMDNIIGVHQLSAGEKNLLIILLTVLTTDTQPGVLLLDEPEICLHIDWQQRLLDDILMLNPNLQIILSTHSPSIVMNGWLDTITEVSDSYVKPTH